MSVPSFRIDYTILRRLPGEDDFADIGFGSSGSWTDVDSALYAVQSDVRRRQWETSEGMPEPEEAGS